MYCSNPTLTTRLFPWILWRVRTDRGVYLTFDDGPHPVYTPAVLDLLAKFKAKATFFLTGSRVPGSEDLAVRIAAEGHTIGNHGYAHLPMWFRELRHIREDIEKTNLRISELTKTYIRLFRPPYGRFDPRFRGLMHSLDLRMVLWSLMPCDFTEKSPARLTERVCRRIRPGEIVVFHDGHPNAPVLIEALPDILRNLRDLGFDLNPLTRDAVCSSGRLR